MSAMQHKNYGVEKEMEPNIEQKKRNCQVQVINITSKRWPVRNHTFRATENFEYSLLSLFMQMTGRRVDNITASSCKDNKKHPPRKKKICSYGTYKNIVEEKKERKTRGVELQQISYRKDTKNNNPFPFLFVLGIEEIKNWENSK